jgi:hypothetical protein
MHNLSLSVVVTLSDGIKCVAFCSSWRGGEIDDNSEFLGFCKSDRTRRKRSCTAHRLLRRFLCGLVRSLSLLPVPGLDSTRNKPFQDLWNLRGPTEGSDRRNSRPRHNRLSLTIQIIQNPHLHTRRYAWPSGHLFTRREL